MEIPITFIFKVKNSINSLKLTDPNDQMRQSSATILVNILASDMNVSNLFPFKILVKLFNTVSDGFKLVENDRK